MTGKNGLRAGLFNINEPVMFGLPIVLNPIPVIPFILVPFVNSLIGYFFISMEFIPPIAYAVPDHARRLSPSLAPAATGWRCLSAFCASRFQHSFTYRL